MSIVNVTQPNLMPDSPVKAARKANPYTSDFTELMRQVKEAGLLRRRVDYYVTKFILLNVSLVALTAVFIFVGPSWWQMLTAAGFAFLFGQVMFLGHDAAHSQIFSKSKYNKWASLILANLYAGMSYGWWNKKHSKHHAKPNQIGSDPDIKTGVLVFHTEDLTAPRNGFSGWFSKRQGWLFFPILLLEGINLHISGIKTIFGKQKIEKRFTEMLFVTLRLISWVALIFWVLPPTMAFSFLGVQLGLFGLYMGLVFAPNHKGMPIVPKDAKIDFLRRQVLMSRNIKGGRFADFMMGGLNYQVEHHLFPSIAHPHLRKVQPMVKKFCEEKSITYTETGVLNSYKIVINYLNEMGLKAVDPFQCPLAGQLREI